MDWLISTDPNPSSCDPVFCANAETLHVSVFTAHQKTKKTEFPPVQTFISLFVHLDSLISAVCCGRVDNIKCTLSRFISLLCKRQWESNRIIRPLWSHWCLFRVQSCSVITFLKELFRLKKHRPLTPLKSSCCELLVHFSFSQKVT